MGIQEKVHSTFKTSAGQDVASFCVLLFFVLTLPLVIAAATQPTVYKKSRAFNLEEAPARIPALPTPAIKVNQPPQITTTRLPDGVMGRQYRAAIKATDPNGNDILAITVPNLPDRLAGLYLNQGSCQTTRTSTSTQMTCNFEGFFNNLDAYQDSPYWITFAVEDNRGVKTRKQLLLNVRRGD